MLYETLEPNQNFGISKKQGESGCPSASLVDLLHGGGAAGGSGCSSDYQK